MNLRRQLLLVSLLLLSLPWAGCQFVREMEGAMREGQTQSLQATAQAIATVLSSQERLLYPTALRRSAATDEYLSLYAVPTQQNVYIDGYDDGWENIESRRFNGAPDSQLQVTVRAQTHGGYLFLMLNVKDPESDFHKIGHPTQPNGDRLILRLWHNSTLHEYVISAIAPGRVSAKAGSRGTGRFDPADIHGYWQDAVGGYTLELKIPLNYTDGRLGFYAVNDLGDGRETDTAGNISPDKLETPPWLIYSPEELQALLAPFSQQGRHIQIVDNDGWQTADIATGEHSARTEQNTFWLLQLLYRSILSQTALATRPTPPRPGKIAGAEIHSALSGAVASQQYRDPQYRTRTVQSVAAPIIDEDGILGAVVIRQSGEAYLSLTDQAFSRLLSYSLLAMAIAALGLLGYASLLSWRIRKLSHAANNAINADGRVTETFPRSTAQDEIGELSRHYAKLLDRVREYNDYLRTLSRKLSHELRTPIAVIQSSLDNLEHFDDQTTERPVYLQRAREGLARLQRILNAMSEANRLEESIRNNTPEKLDLVPLVTELFAVYRGIYPQYQLSLDIQDTSAPVTGVADLIVQALDKLMENAASFCRAGDDIMLQLHREENSWNLSLSNSGPTLPLSLRDRLFDPMVSLRKEQTGDVHLGLGLHIVSLISDFHGGRVTADNLPDESGVIFSLRFPVEG